MAHEPEPIDESELEDANGEELPPRELMSLVDLGGDAAAIEPLEGEPPVEGDKQPDDELIPPPRMDPT